MSDLLSAIWDGEEHLLTPGDLWPETGATQIIVGYEELEEEDVLSPLESPSRAPILRETRSRPHDSRFPLAATEQGWAALSIELTAFASIVGCTKKQYQLVWPGPGAKPDKVGWSFITTEHTTERM